MLEKYYINSHIQTYKTYIQKHHMYTHIPIMCVLVSRNLENFESTTCLLKSDR